MKKFLKNSIIGIALVASLITTANAAVVATSMTTNDSYWVILTNSAHLGEVTLISTSSVVVRFFDTTAAANSSASVTYTNGAYTNIVIYTTNLVNNYTTSTGVTNYFTNSVLWTATSSAAAATNNYSPFSILYAAANVPFTVNLNKDLMRGLVVSNSTTNVTIITRYTYNKP